MYTDEGLRRCDQCGRPMKEGFLFPSDEYHICSEECLLAFYDGDAKQLEEDRALIDESDEVFFYTEWDSEYQDD